MSTPTLQFSSPAVRSLFELMSDPESSMYVADRPDAETAAEAERIVAQEDAHARMGRLLNEQDPGDGGLGQGYHLNV